LSISNLDVEDSLVSVGGESNADGSAGAGRIVEIGSLIRFSTNGLLCGDDDDDAGDDNDGLLIEAPSVSLHVKTRTVRRDTHSNSAKPGTTTTTDVELSLQPMELTYQYTAN
jgi:hypothetical protein